MKNIIRLSTFLLILSSLTFLPSCEEENLSNPDLALVNGLDITGGQEVPVVSTRGAGNLDVRYDKANKQLTLTFAWGNLTDSVTAMHIHGPALPGVAGPVLVPFTNFPRGKYGSHTQTFRVDEVTLKEAELFGDQYYVNIHTKAFPGGEIRGQILFDEQ